MNTRAPQLHPEVVTLLERAAALTQEDAQALSEQWPRHFAPCDRSVPGRLAHYCAAPLVASEAALDVVWQRAEELDPDAPWSEVWTIARTAVQATAAALATVLEWAPADEQDASNTQLADRAILDELYARATGAWRSVIGPVRQGDVEPAVPQPAARVHATSPSTPEPSASSVRAALAARAEFEVDEMLRLRPGRFSFGQWAARTDEQGWRYRALAAS